jgi:hypothetical protein
MNKKYFFFFYHIFFFSITLKKGLDRLNKEIILFLMISI